MTRMPKIAKNHLREFEGAETFSFNPVWDIVDAQNHTPIIAGSISDSIF